LTVSAIVISSISKKKTPKNDQKIQKQKENKKPKKPINENSKQYNHSTLTVTSKKAINLLNCCNRQQLEKVSL
jgi:hypothetical protein